MRPKTHEKQLKLIKTTAETKHGGGLEKGRRKTKRPLTPKLALHVTLRAQQAQGQLSLLHPKHAQKIQTRLQEIARRFRVRVHQYANSGNHIHLLLRGQSREDLQNFFRTATAQIAQLVTGARKGHPLKQCFWDSLIFTRIVAAGRDFTNVRWYVLKNDLEGEGIIDHDRSENIRRKTNKASAPPFPNEFASAGWR